MKKGTKVGLLLVAASIILSVWVIVSQSSNANTTLEGGFTVSDDQKTLISYEGEGGDITIPDGVESITAAAFSGNAAITKVTIPASVTTLGSGVFQGCSNLGSVTFQGSGITAIPANTFRECTSLSTVDLPGSVTTIGSAVFYGCSALSSITIPASVSSLSMDAFDGCYNLNAFASNSSSYPVVDGCLYNAGKTRLLLVPRGRTSVSVGAGTTEIAGGAFADCRSLSTLSLPRGVVRIESGAFSGSGITAITIPSSVTEIGGQGDWRPDGIYGEADSYAEKYAMDNNIPFYADGAPGGENPGNSGDNSGGNAGDNNGGNTGDNNGGNAGDNNGGNAGGNVGDGSGVDAGGGTGGQPGGNGSGAQGGNSAAGTGTSGGSTNGQGSGNGTHTLDETPTTADGIDPRYFLCLAIFAGGIGVILYSRFNKLRYVNDKRSH